MTVARSRPCDCLETMWKSYHAELCMQGRSGRMVLTLRRNSSARTCRSPHERDGSLNPGRHRGLPLRLMPCGLSPGSLLQCGHALTSPLPPDRPGQRRRRLSLRGDRASFGVSGTSGHRSRQRGVWRHGKRRRVEVGRATYGSWSTPSSTPWSWLEGNVWRQVTCPSRSRSQRVIRWT